MSKKDESELCGIKQNDSGLSLFSNLPPEIRDSGTEIRWFKDTDCVCLYKNNEDTKGKMYENRVSLITDDLKSGNISFELTDSVWMLSGDYLCQVISKDRTEEHSVRVEAPWISSVAPCKFLPSYAPWKFLSSYVTIEKSNRKWTEDERKKMEKSIWLIKKVNVYKMTTGNKLNCDEFFIEKLHEEIPGLRVNEKEYDFVPVFCPIVSQAGTDTEEAVKLFSAKMVNKPAAFVVLHMTYNPHKIVPNCSEYVKIDDALVVDCLFDEDKGLLDCSKNNEAIQKVVKRIKQQEREIWKKLGVEEEPKEAS